jgi:hypothetical protein
MNHEPKEWTMRIRPIARSLTATAGGLGVAGALALASSHREAPLITSTPKLDCADFYLFNSYEPGRSNYVTLVANYLPLQDAYGGPNYFQLDANALYEVHVDNTGDAMEDLTFQFRFTNAPRGFPLAIGPAGDRRTNDVPVLAVGPVSATNTAALLVDQTYTLTLIRGNRRNGPATAITNAADGSTTFTKPQDNVGNKTFPDYDAYANACIYSVLLPGTTHRGRVFVGQRKDPFVVNLGETFDLVNISTSPLGPVDANKDSLDDKNVTSLILELPKDFVTRAADQPIIGAWSTSSRIDGTNITQVSRLGMPLVNEVVIGLKDKDRFNASEPKDDLGSFADYVTHPTLPAILELLYGSAGVKAPTLFPREDLVAAFVTGIEGLNKDGGAGEMQRLNTAIAATPRASQNNLGVIGGDNGGFPNGRRPGDDVVDIELRVAMGRLIALGLFGNANQAPSGLLDFTDGATVNSMMFPDRFPYLNSPLPGSPNDPSITITLQSAASVAGPYRSVPASFDSNSQKLTAAKPSSGAGFYRLKTDGKAALDDIQVQGDEVRIGVK